LANYNIVPSKGFEKELGKLSDIDKQAVFNKIALLEDNPFYPSLRTKKLKGNSGCYESSVNMSIRMIWQFENNKIILMLDVGHHDVLRKY
jgi:mRNA-degrading endonuclease RelE of RelBE toxin-antitoxin system